MNYDANELAKLREARRHNIEAEEAERKKAKAAELSAIAKMGDTVTKGATGMASILTGRNDGDWGMTKDEGLDATYDQSYVAIDLEQKYLPNGLKRPIGLATVDYQPMLGSVAGNSVNSTFLAMKRIYDIMRGKNRGATNYTVANVTQYFMPCLTIAAQIAYHELVLKLFHHPNLKMRVTIRDAFTALGIDYSDFSAHLPDYEIRINRLKAVLDQFPLPLELPVLKRWIWLSSFAFLDAPGNNATFFVCRPQYYFTPFTSGPHHLCSTQTTTLATAASGANRTYAQISQSMDLMEDTLGRMLLDTTLQAVAGDILNAFDGKLVKWTKSNIDVEEDPFYYDEEFLLELSNARICKMTGTTGWPGTGISYDGFGNIGQGYMNATQRLMPLVGTFRDTYFTSGACGGDKQLIFTNGHATLTREQTNIAESWMHTYGANMSVQTVYYWDDTDPGNEFKSYTMSAGTGNTLAFIHAYGTEIITAITTYWVNAAGSVQAGVVQDSNECFDMSDIFTTAQLDHYVWRYYLDTGNTPVLVETDLDNYGIIMSTALETSIRVKNMALWGYASLKIEGKSPSGIGGKGERKHFKKPKSPKPAQGESSTE